jgi:hypothetical protein
MSLPLITVPAVLIVEGPVYRVRVTPVCCHPVVDALGHTVDVVLDVVPVAVDGDGGFTTCEVRAP